MHARNPYRNPPDFLSLANTYPDLQPYVFMTANGTSAIDFKDEAAQRCLTQALLFRDYGITLTLPNNRLCPPIPNRLNYVLWIQDIVQACRMVSNGESSETVRGLDIGTGASAIYPLLACKLEPEWRFIATDVDELSINSARINVDRNGLQDRIDIFPVNPDGPILIPIAVNSEASFNFTMCNPPFYSSAEDVAQSAEAKEFGPNSVCTGADVEMLTPGGESAFVSEMVLESIEQQTRCCWYTSMLGKMTSLFEIVYLLRKHSIDNYAITEFVQGQTRRWAIGWSFGDVRLPDNLSRIHNAALRSIAPSRNTRRQPFPQARSASHLHELLVAVLQSIKGVSYQRAPADAQYLIPPILVCAFQDTWSRSARRKTSLTSVVQISVGGTLEPQIPALRCIFGYKLDKPGQGTIVLDARWGQGRDRSLFDSFCSHICRKLEGRLRVAEQGRNL